MTQEAYVTFEVAKLLRDKGFDTPSYITGHVYSEHGTLQSNTSFKSVTMDYITACTQQMAMRWLREKHNIVIAINILNENNEDNIDYTNPDRWWYYWLFTDEKGVYEEKLQPDFLKNEYPTYEEATEAAIKYCLENLI